MLPIEKYGQMYLAMISATANPELQQQICQQHGVSLADWTEANAHFMAKMSDPSDMGQTAMAFAKYMTPAAAPVPVLDLPDSFTTNQIDIFTNELMVQMVVFTNGRQHVELQMSVTVDPEDEFLTNYVKGRVHLSINEQNYSIYGGVSQVAVNRNSVTFHFDEEGKERMKCDSITVKLDISNKKYQYLCRTLRHMYRQHPVLVIAEESFPSAETWDGVTYDLSWGSFELNENFKVALRPNVANLIALEKYNQLVVISLKNEGTEDALFDSFAQEMELCFESDYSTIIAITTRAEETNQMSLYTTLPQEKFMVRLNEALCYLPHLPLDITGATEPDWGNYMDCYGDYLAQKNS